MTILLLALSGFLLGGAMSMHRQGARGHVVLLLAVGAGMAFLAGVLRL